MNVCNGEPALDGCAGLTEHAAKVAGEKGFVDTEIHAGFISKQTGLPPAEIPMHVEKRTTSLVGVSNPSPGGAGFVIEPAVEAEEEVFGGSGGTERTAEAAGQKHGYVDHDLHAGFVTKQTPLSLQ